MVKVSMVSIEFSNGDQFTSQAKQKLEQRLYELNRELLGELDNSPPEDIAPMIVIGGPPDRDRCPTCRRPYKEDE